MILAQYDNANAQTLKTTLTGGFDTADLTAQAEPILLANEAFFAGGSAFTKVGENIEISLLDGSQISQNDIIYVSAIDEVCKVWMVYADTWAGGYSGYKLLLGQAGEGVELLEWDDYLVEAPEEPGYIQEIQSQELSSGVSKNLHLPKQGTLELTITDESDIEGLYLSGGELQTVDVSLMTGLKAVSITDCLLPPAAIDELISQIYVIATSQSRTSGFLRLTGNSVPGEQAISTLELLRQQLGWQIAYDGISELTYNHDRTAIANMALSLLGNEQIISLDEDSLPARVCRLHLNQARRLLLTAAPWVSCAKQVYLALISKIDGEYIYQLPLDLLRLDKIYTSRDLTADWQIRNGKLYINAEVMKIDYFGDIEYDQMSPQLAECLIYLVASKISGQITGDKNITERLTAQYQQVLLPAAAAAESQNRQAEDRNVDSWV